MNHSQRLCSVRLPRSTASVLPVCLFHRRAPVPLALLTPSAFLISPFRLSRPNCGAHSPHPFAFSFDAKLWRKPPCALHNPPCPLPIFHKLPPFRSASDPSKFQLIQIRNCAVLHCIARSTPSFPHDQTASALLARRAPPSHLANPAVLFHQPPAALKMKYLQQLSSVRLPHPAASVSPTPSAFLIPPLLLDHPSRPPRPPPFPALLRRKNAVLLLRRAAARENSFSARSPPLTNAVKRGTLYVGFWCTEEAIPC